MKIMKRSKMTQWIRFSSRLALTLRTLQNAPYFAYDITKFILPRQQAIIGINLGLVYWRIYSTSVSSLRWRHNGCDSVSNHQPHHCLLNRLFRRRSKKTSKLRVTGLCAGNSPGTGELSAQMASNAENVSIWWRHHVNTSIVIIFVT